MTEKLGELISKSNNILDEVNKIIGGLNKHLKDTECEHCKELLRKIFAKEVK